jgi:hypothetical protein
MTHPGEVSSKAITFVTRPTAEKAKKRPKCNAKKDSNGVKFWDCPTANTRKRGRNINAKDHTNKLYRARQSAPHGGRFTNVMDVAQAHEAVALSFGLDSSEYVGGREEEPGAASIGCDRT